MLDKEAITITRWDKNQAVDVDDLKSRLIHEGLNPFTHSDSAGTFYPSHSHPYSEIRWVVSGAITLGIDGEEITLYPGDRLELKADVPHYAKTANDSVTSYVCASKLS